MNLLALKLILTPLFVGGATLVARRFGPRVAGWLVGLPLTSGPVAFYLALEQGTGFAARAAQATLLGQISFATFCLTYRWLSPRFGWLGCWLGSWSAFFILTFVLQQVSLPLPMVFISVVGVLLLTLRLLGAAAAWQVLRGVVVGSFAYALFFLLIATLIASRGILVAFGCAIAGALLIQGCTLWLMHRQSPRF